MGVLHLLAFFHRFSAGPATRTASGVPSSCWSFAAALASWLACLQSPLRCQAGAPCTGELHCSAAGAVAGLASQNAGQVRSGQVASGRTGMCWCHISAPILRPGSSVATSDHLGSVTPVMPFRIPGILPEAQQAGQLAARVPEALGPLRFCFRTPS